jgi:hypothetical protein
MFIATLGIADIVDLICALVNAEIASAFVALGPAWPRSELVAWPAAVNLRDH